MGIQRSNIVQGPGTIQLGSAGPVFYDKDNIEANVEPTNIEIRTSMHGAVDRRFDDRKVVASWTPSGQITSDIISALYPHLDPTIGSDIFGASDTPSNIHSRAGQKVLLHNTAITKMPDLMLSPVKTAFGAAEITALLKDNADPTDANSIYTISAEAWSDASFASANVKTLVYAGVWTDILTDITTEDGWTIAFELGVKPRVIDDYGTVGMLLESVGVMAKCKPANLSESDVFDALRIQDSGAGRGASMRRDKDLVITGAGSALVVTLKDAALDKGPLVWGSTELRPGELGWFANRAESAGTFGALCTISVS